MRKMICLMLAAMLLLASFGAVAESTNPPVDSFDKKVERVTVPVERAMDHFTMANPTRMKGHFFTGLWDNDTSDIDARTLVEGYNLIEFDGGQGEYRVDPTVVSGVMVTENSEGDRSYILALSKDLLYSDGTPITAWDYAFSFLFSIDARINDLGGIAESRDYLLGCRDYITRTAELKGTRLILLDGRTVERVDTVWTADGEPLAYGDVLGDRTELTLARNQENELILPPMNENVPENLLVHADAQGVIQDWHYENGVRVFADGSHATLPGVHVTSNSTLVITVDHRFLPFFFEMGMLYCSPYPIQSVAPGVEVRDDGDGVYLANAKNQPQLPENPDAPQFCVKNLMVSVKDPEEGYLYLPRVSSGPYKLLSFDGMTAEFELNPYYKGNSKGEKPIIPTLTFTLADNENMVEKLAEGEFDGLNKVTKATTIADALKLMSTRSFIKTEEEAERILETEYVSANGYSMVNYPRIGLSYIAFCCEQDTVSSQAVRQAIAWCMDRDLMTRDYTGGYGLRVDGYYGLGQWMFGLVEGTLAYPVEQPEDENNAGAWKAYEDEIAQWEALSLDTLTVYHEDLQQARRLLDRDGWVLNDEGIREKNGVKLDLRMIYPEGNAMRKSFEERLIPNLEAVGIRLTLVPVPLEELLGVYYRLPEYTSGRTVSPDLMDEDRVRSMDMIYMASDLEIVFDPSIHFVLEQGEHSWESTLYVDQQLYDLAWDMTHTEPGHVLEYMQRWIDFQEYFNETLPMLPIYSNVYFDFTIGELQGYDIDESVTWGQAIVGAELVDGATAQDAETEGVLEETDDGELEIID